MAKPTSGMPAWVISCTPPLSASDVEPAKASTLGMRSATSLSLVEAFCWSSSTSRLSVRPQIPPAELMAPKSASTPWEPWAKLPVQRPGDAAHVAEGDGGRRDARPRRRVAGVAGAVCRLGLRTEVETGRGRGRQAPRPGWPKRRPPRRVRDRSTWRPGWRRPHPRTPDPRPAQLPTPRPRRSWSCRRRSCRSPTPRWPRRPDRRRCRPRPGTPPPAPRTRSPPGTTPAPPAPLPISCSILPAPSIRQGSHPTSSVTE